MFADEYQFGFVARKRLEIPAASDKIEEVRSIRETDKPFGAINFGGQIGYKLLKFFASKDFGGGIAERSKFGLVDMVRRRAGFLFTRDSKQEVRINLAPLSVQDRSDFIDAAQFLFHRFEVAFCNQIYLVKEDEIGLFDLETR